jgi:uncharacterized protein YueI
MIIMFSKMLQNGHQFPVQCVSVEMDKQSVTQYDKYKESNNSFKTNSINQQYLYLHMAIIKSLKLINLQKQYLYLHMAIICHMEICIFSHHFDRRIV